jgi:hypothetical protein
MHSWNPPRATTNPNPNANYDANQLGYAQNLPNYAHNASYAGPQGNQTMPSVSQGARQASGHQAPGIYEFHTRPSEF